MLCFQMMQEWRNDPKFCELVCPEVKEDHKETNFLERLQKAANLEYFGSQNSKGDFNDENGLIIIYSLEKTGKHFYFLFPRVPECVVQIGSIVQHFSALISWTNWNPERSEARFQMANSKEKHGYSSEKTLLLR